ncbi:MAG: hypothetical protein PHW19_13205, partial [Salinivirgaceae bacterium]|nr:hypothetical protein [Salinivirgaceae bacterium]
AISTVEIDSPGEGIFTSIIIVSVFFIFVQLAICFTLADMIFPILYPNPYWEHAGKSIQTSFRDGINLDRFYYQI